MSLPFVTRSLLNATAQMLLLVTNQTFFVAELVRVGVFFKGLSLVLNRCLENLSRLGEMLKGLGVLAMGMEEILTHLKKPRVK